MPVQLELAEEVAVVGIEAAESGTGRTLIAAGAKLAEECVGSFETAPANIQFKAATGEIERLSAAEFEQKFSVKYLPKLAFNPDCPIDPLAKLPETPVWAPGPATQREALAYDFGRSLRNGFGNSQLYGDGERKAWLYSEQIKSGDTANMYIAKIDDVVGHGMFANENIAQGSMLGEYTGLARRSLGELEKHNAYAFSYGPEGAIDARVMGNVTRFINHSEMHPNAAQAKVIVDGVPHVILVATDTIEKDAQILFDYGPGYWQERSAQVLDTIKK